MPAAKLAAGLGGAISMTNIPITASPQTVSHPPMLSREAREGLTAYLFLAPNLISLGLFVVAPLFAGLAISLTDWDMMSSPTWVGAANYAGLLSDPALMLSLKVTLLYSLMVIPGGLIVSMLIALALNSDIRGLRIYQAILFLPYVSSTVAVALAWKWIYNPQYGILNAALRTIGLPQPDWLTDPAVAIVSVAIVSIWQTAGYNAILLMAGMRSIPKHYYEAASMDGATGWQKFWRITLPLLKPTIFFVMVTSLINSFIQSFNIIFVMTGGGPGNATKVLMFYIWENAFNFFKMGYASAISYLLFVLLIAVTILQLRVTGRGAEEIR